MLPSAAIRVEQLKGFLIKRGYKEDLIDSQVGRVFNLDRSSVLEYSKKRGLKKDYVERMVLTLVFTLPFWGFMGSFAIYKC